MRSIRLIRSTSLRITAALGAAAAVALVGCSESTPPVPTTTTVVLDPSSAPPPEQNGAPFDRPLDDLPPEDAPAPDHPPAAHPAADGAHAAAGGPIPATAVPVQTVKPQLGGVAVFVVPSGNIGCGVYPDRLECRIGNYHVDAPYGRDASGGGIDTMLIENGSASLAHHSGDVPPYMERAFGPDDRIAPQVVGYGQIVYHGPYVCASQEHGLTCWDSDSGSGAFMSRERTDIF